MRLKTASSLALLFLASAALAAAPEFRDEIRAFGAAPGSLALIVEGREAVTSPNVLSQVGGVLFQGRIREFGPLALDRLRAEADVHVQDGIVTITLRQRKFLFWTTEYRYVGPAWIIADSVRFASTPQTAAVTFFGVPSEDEKEIIYSAEALAMERQATALLNAHNRNAQHYNQCLGSLQDRFLINQMCGPVLTNYLGRQTADRLLADVFNSSLNIPQIGPATPSTLEMLNQSFVWIRLDQSLARIATRLEEEAKEISELFARTQLKINASEFMHQFYITDLHPQLAGTQLGFRLMQADSMISSWSLLQSTVVGGVEVLFPGDLSQLDSTGQISEGARAASASLSDLYKKCQRAHERLEARAWILTDFDVEYNIIVNDNGLLHIGGEPFFYVWGHTKGDDAPEPEIFELSECTSELRSNSGLYEELNWNVWMAARESARATALFRSLKDDAPDLFWSIFEDFAAHRYEFFTPRAWPRNGRL